jgi:hypothetical protein
MPDLIIIQSFFLSSVFFFHCNLSPFYFQKMSLFYTVYVFLFLKKRYVREVLYISYNNFITTHRNDN